MQIVTTLDSEALARRIAEALLDARLVACVQIEGPITSIYWWKGAKETSTEYRCVMKTRADLYTEVEKVIIAMHTYETPEIVAIPIVAGGEDYLQWITTETGG